MVYNGAPDDGLASGPPPPDGGALGCPDHRQGQGIMERLMTPSSVPQTTPARPLVVDLDGTLIKTDLLIESFLVLLGAHPLKALGSLSALSRGKAALKARIADEVVIDLHTLPLNQPLLARLRAEKAAGRALYLASASDRRYVEPLAAHLGLFDGVFASDGHRNLAGPAKAQRLCEAFGEGGFDYVGDALVDMAVWDRAAGVLVVAPSPALRQTVCARFPHAEVIGEHIIQPKDWVKALRLHQWLKNLLIFVPLLAAHAINTGSLATSLVAFFSFGFCASSVYLLNDLLDLAHDRRHPSKCRRPFAAGLIPLKYGLALIPVLILVSMLLALDLPRLFLAVLALYYLLTLAYSLWLKRRMMVDVVLLACLYGIRVVAGGVAVAVPLSVWLVAFSLFLFFSLALVKRCAELIDHAGKGAGDPSGRGYRQEDLPILLPMATASGYLSVLVLALYINNPVVGRLYAAPELLWPICTILLYWISRVLVLTHRGDMHDDPVIFAVTDRVSLISGALIVLAGMAASL